MKIQPVGISIQFGKRNTTFKKSEETKSVSSKKVVNTTGKVLLAGMVIAAIATGLNFIHQIRTGRLILVRTIDEQGKVISRSFARLIKK